MRWTDEPRERARRLWLTLVPWLGLLCGLAYAVLWLMTPGRGGW